jgi:hypothetical protein
MTAPSSESAEAVDALAGHIYEEGSIKFGELATYLKARGIPIEGDEEITGAHINQPHVGEYTTLLGPVSAEYVQIVEALFKSRPVMLEIGDPALFATGDEPWWVTWNGHRDALVDAAIEFVHDRGAVTFMDLADHLQVRGVEIHGRMTMILGRHAVGDGIVMTRPSNPLNVVLWNGGSAEYLRILELILNRDPRVVLERTSVERYALDGMVLLEDYTDDSRPETRLPSIDFYDELATHGYEIPTWLPVMFAWAGGD